MSIEARKTRGYDLKALHAIPKCEMADSGMAMMAARKEELKRLKELQS
jgi:hypothetical protein